MELEKEDALSEWYHKVLKEAKIVDSRYPIKGTLVYRKWGVFVIRSIQRELEKMLETAGHEPTFFPVMIPENILGKETKHIAGFEDEVFWITHAGKNKLDVKLALRPTSETPMYEMFSLWIRSYNDLPFKIHQSCAVYRYETKHTRPLIRGREFLWNEGHSAHTDYGDAEKNISEIKEIYKKLINELLCLPFIIDRRPEWDKFPGAEYTLAFDTIMPDGKVLQIATAHHLGENFARVFDIKYEDETGKQKFVHQTSYGPSFGRLLAAAILIHGDEKGLVLPPKIAPVQVVIVPIVFKGKTDEIYDYANKIKEKLDALGIRNIIDSRELHAGEKYYHWEMKGVPVRFEAGPRDLKAGKVFVARRDTGEKFALDYDEINNKIFELFKNIEDNLRDTAQEKFEKKFFKAENFNEIDEFTGKGIIESGWCGEKSCADEIEKHSDMIAVEEGKDAACPVCGGFGYRIRVAKTY